ncbi:MAG TPA: cytochrome P450 [Trebonia sp.]|nr:cytochrome P450 [Trebonia sp.]
MSANSAEGAAGAGAEGSDAGPAPREYPFSDPRALELDPIYARLLRDDPMPRVHLPYGDDAWLLTTYDDVQAGLADGRFSRAATLTHDLPRLHAHRVDCGILDLDPPEHTRLRRLVARAFTPRRVETLRERAQREADELIDAMLAAGPPADLVEHFAVPLPGVMICELLGVPFADRENFYRWGTAFMSTTALTAQQRETALGELAAYLGRLVELRRLTPTGDLLNALVVARDEHESLSEAEVIGMAITLFTAGYESTASQIANFAYTLLTEPGQLQVLREQPDLVPGAVEELLRYVPLSANEAELPRYATQDVELSAGTVRKDEPVLVGMYAANRDPRVYEDPDRLDVTRVLARPHLAFGHGVHHCIGAPLARMDLQVAMGTLLARLPGLRLAVEPEQLAWKSGLAMRGPITLPVAW